MNVYRRLVLPRLTDLAMGLPVLAEHRRRTVALARGTVLELGFGSGLNLPLYDPSQVTRLYALEPEAGMIALARKRLARVPFPVEVLQAGAERIPLPDASVDTVLTTWTLCTVPLVEQALLEARRVSRPGGRFVFVEHGLAPDAGVAAWQRRLTPVWRRCAGGCRLDRRADALLQAAGFRIEALSTGYARGPRVLTYMYRGIAAP